MKPTGIRTLLALCFASLVVVTGFAPTGKPEALTDQDIVSRQANPIGASVTIDELKAKFDLSALILPSRGTTTINTVSNPYGEVFTLASNGNPMDDKYELQFNRNTQNYQGREVTLKVFGTGMEASAHRVELDDFLDVNFSVGHVWPPDAQHPYEGDIGRLRTAIFVIPSYPTRDGRSSFLVLYDQEAVKKVRLSRAGQHQCPIGNTCIVVKKHDRPEYQQQGDTTGKLVLIKATNVQRLYQAYRYYLEQNDNRFFKKPHWAAFGLGWEAAIEYVCGVRPVTKDDVNNIVLRAYRDNKIALSHLTIGSGYWAGENPNLCGDQPTIDKLQADQRRWGGVSGLNDLFKQLAGLSIYPIIGMRHHAHPAQAAAFASRIGFYPFLSDHIYKGAPTLTTQNVVLNINPQVMASYITELHEAYGSFRGIKEDEMIPSDQIGYGAVNPVNFRDDYISQAYRYWVDREGSDFLVMGRNDYLGVGTDGQNGQGALLTRPAPEVYDVKYLLDSALTQVVSGYPHPKLEPFGSPNPCSRDGIPAGVSTTEYLRTFALVTFMPISMHSCGFWHLTNPGDKSAFVFFSQLRNRLHQYAYDQAQRWYETGIPWLLQPLFVRWPEYDVYGQYERMGSPDQPRDGFMFGNALYVQPVFTDRSTVNVALPPGRYVGLLKNFGPVGSNTAITRTTYTLGANNLDYPVFLKEGEILVIGEPNDPYHLMAYVFLGDKTESDVYTLYWPYDNSKGSTPKIDIQAFKDAKDGYKVKIRRVDTDLQIDTVPACCDKKFYMGDLQWLLPITIPGG